MAYFRILDQGTDPNGEVNADWITTRPDCIIWMDGATPFGSTRVSSCANDATWFVRRFAQVLMDHLDASVPSDTAIVAAQQKLHREYEALVAQAPAKPLDKPFSCLGLARIFEKSIELVNMGDCSLLYEIDGRVASFGYSTVTDLDHEVISAFRKLRDPTVSYAAAFDMLKPKLDKNRAKRNVQFGYNVVEPTDRERIQFERVLLPISAMGRLLAMSDGFARAFSLYGISTLDNIFELVETEGVGGIISRIRSVEDSDPNAEQYPRLKLKDDASAVLFSIA
ncbi:protein phosphatase 2C domain-containing protein [Bradyrhizobium sp. 21]|nr:protein phosphatase 2C domain-containing protein [Bradyrhizobium sp. 21]